MREDIGLLLVASVSLMAAIALLVAEGPDGPRSTARPPSGRPSVVAPAGGGAAGLMVLVCSGWVVPAVVVGVAGAVGIRSRLRRRPRQDAARTDALASWIENLRDVLLAGDQPIGAIGATVDTCPAAIRPEVRRLALGLGHLEPEPALRRFADDIDDPLGDLVAAGLLIAVERGARTVDVLTSLAAQARSQADRRRLVDAERAPLQREVALLSIVMAALVGVLLLFGRSAYLRAYDSVDGQFVLGTVLVLYVLLLVRVRRLATHPSPRRFLLGPAATIAPTEADDAHRPTIGSPT